MASLTDMGTLGEGEIWRVQWVGTFIDSVLGIWYYGSNRSGISWGVNRI